MALFMAEMELADASMLSVQCFPCFLIPSGLLLHSVTADNSTLHIAYRFISNL